MAQSQLRTTSAGPKFRRSGNFFFLRCFGFTGGKRKTNFKKKSPTDAITYRKKKSHWFGFSTKKYAANTLDKTDRCDLKPSNSTDESKFIIKNKLSGKLDTIAEISCKDMVEEKGKFQNPLFSGVRTDMVEIPEKSTPIIAADHTLSIFLPPQATAVKTKTNSRIHRKSEVMLSSSERVDPAVGFFIVTLNLVIMLVWGKVCAILCASAFLYIVPRFRTSGSKRKRQSGPIAVSSSEGNSGDDSIVKNKVVFDGFLERNRRSSFGHR